MASRMTYRTADAAARGGRLRIGIWESPGLRPEQAADRTVLAVHGISASHLAWALVARRLTEVPGTRLIAPDLRGRGRSADLPGPWGMEQHADDLAAVVDRVGAPDVTVGHSMGGFAIMAAQHRHPGRFGELLLLDGGVPLPRPAGLSVETHLAQVLGPAADRMARRFADRESYRRFWAAHPAFAGAWSAEMLAYIDYDLVRSTGELGRDDAGWRCAARFEAVAQDFGQLGNGIVADAWTALTSQGSAVPLFVRSPLGLLADPPGLYPTDALERFAVGNPGFRWIDIPDTNHYTLVLGEHGAQQVVGILEGRLGENRSIQHAVTDEKARPT